VGEEKTHSLALRDLKDLVNKKHFLHNKVPVYLKDLMVLNVQVSLDKVLELLELRVPESLIPNLGTIWIGEFPELDRMNVDSFFKNETVFFSSKIPTLELLFYTMLYEMSNVMADNFSTIIHADGSLEREFLSKRVELYNRLTPAQKKAISIQKFFDVKSDTILFRFLYKKLRRPYLERLCKGIYPHSTGAASLLNYLAMTFYLLKASLRSREELEKISPIAVAKIQMLIEYAKG
jgi:hypothetical protein